MRTKTKPAPPVRRCPDCGVSVPAGPFQPTIPSTSTWTRCADCTTAGRDGTRASMLARMGVEHPADDPIVDAALRTVAWRAVALETERANAEAEKRTRPIPQEPRGSRERRVAQALAGIDGVGTPSVEPWSHVNARNVRHAVEQAIVATAQGGRLRQCTDGPCGVCGTRLAVTWPLSVPIGTVTMLAPRPRRPWPICSTCAPLLEAAGGTPTSEQARRRWTAVVLGVPASPPPLSVPALVGTYAEFVGVTTDPRGADGCAAPWDFVSQADRDVLAQAAPQHRPPEVLDRERRIAAARARVERSRRADAPPTALATGSGR